eukprot:m.164644 g.164644  ORF g.164644 m.164644 type:complete len:61 (-) comp18114_c0_seq1:1508-1690(-)
MLELYKNMENPCTFNIPRIDLREPHVHIYHEKHTHALLQRHLLGGGVDWHTVKTEQQIML